jgi:hypothetical protein
LEENRSSKKFVVSPSITVVVVKARVGIKLSSSSYRDDEGGARMNVRQEGSTDGAHDHDPAAVDHIECEPAKDGGYELAPIWITKRADRTEKISVPEARGRSAGKRAEEARKRRDQAAMTFPRFVTSDYNYGDTRLSDALSNATMAVFGRPRPQSGPQSME